MDEQTLPLVERLERGEVVCFSPCPFTLPDDNDRSFLLDQRLHAAKKNISFNPSDNTVAGFRHHSTQQAQRLAGVMAAFSRQASQWLPKTLPRYAAAMQPDRTSFRPEEEAIRKLRQTARNDLLHIDAFPSRPTQGRRILRLFVNINPAEPRVWATSDTFAKILRDHGKHVGLPNLFTEGWAARLGQGFLSLFQPGSEKRTLYDRFMLRLHHYLKTNDTYQEQAPKRFWHFPPNTAWLVFTDGLSHAELRGRYALEHSFFISPDVLALPDESPAALLARACGLPVLPRAA
jgi:hypothetical protein